AASTGNKIRLSDLKGKRVVLYFYPKDNTPGCTLEARSFRDCIGNLDALGAIVLGVSPDTIESHCSFTDKFNLNFALLSDSDHAVAEKYGVWVEKNMYGKKRWGIQRATFLIDEDGTIAHVWPKVKPEGHAEAVLQVLKAR
ncbi:MAG TPA: thioredoxin-dependent thiol peroxidase, partial [Candidatus Hydrogenedentes bacterium]|nr:thioredoxin-dependent thiol peroxidase [Candidatus Hydrogenedentota bacterium]